MSRDGSPLDRGTSRTQNLSRQKEGGANALSGARAMTAQIFSFRRRETIIQQLRAAEAEIFLVVEQESGCRTGRGQRGLCPPHGGDRKNSGSNSENCGTALAVLSERVRLRPGSFAGFFFVEILTNR